MTNIQKGGPARTAKVIVLGCFPPRRCGIATFTQDTVEAIRSVGGGLNVSVIAMDDGSQDIRFEDPVIASLKQHDLGAYVDAAAIINAQKPDCLIIQHEFGIFGGPAGEFLLTLLALVKVPVITIFHTVLERPDYNQLRVMRRLLHRSNRLVVMAQRGADMLRDVYGATVDRIAVIPHGAPTRPQVDPRDMRAKLGIQADRMISTFGLLSPNKGIETVIQSMPEVLEQYPSTIYVILGVTHPHLVAREGEAYRQSLEALAEKLGVVGSIRFVNRFVENEELFDYLQASDVYVTPYLNEAQITSGTLSYALALGCHVISTPYWHAQEVFADCPGTLVPPADVGAIRNALLKLFGDGAALEVSRDGIYQWAEHTRWPEFGARFSVLIADASRIRSRISHISERHGPAFPAVSLRAIERMTDSCGIFQHSRFAAPDRNHGYCVDDNARALILVNELIRSGMMSADIERLHGIYTGFVLHSFAETSGTFRNFMGYDRTWEAKPSSQDSQGRAFWAYGHAAATEQYAGNKGWAATVLQQCVHRMGEITSPRARAFIILGCAELMQSDSKSDQYAGLMQRFSEELLRQLQQCRSDDWHWLEDTLSYDNGRIPQALLVAGRLSGSGIMVRAALASLEWLCDVQLIDHGFFAPVGAESFGRLRLPPLPNDQQPIEAAAMLDACYQAFLVTRDTKWWRRAKTLFSWFYGLNSHELSLVDPVTGLCHDGLNRSGLNLNAGAESLLAFQMSICTYQAFLEEMDKAPRKDVPGDSRQAVFV